MAKFRLYCWVETSQAMCNSELCPSFGSSECILGLTGINQGGKALQLVNIPMKPKEKDQIGNWEPRILFELSFVQGTGNETQGSRVTGRQLFDLVDRPLPGTMTARI